jgi:hypothetical protein
VKGRGIQELSGRGSEESLDTSNPFLFKGIGDKGIEVLRAQNEAWMSHQLAEGFCILDLEDSRKEPLLERILSMS